MILDWTKAHTSADLDELLAGFIGSFRLHIFLGISNNNPVKHMLPFQLVLSLVGMVDSLGQPSMFC
jgi:hypothetical protein